MWIMVAGPYRAGTGDEAGRAANLRVLNDAALALWQRGHVPVIGVNMALPMIEAAGPEIYEALMAPISLALAERCDAVLRLGGPSSGADREVELIRSRGGRVFAALDEVPPA